MNLLGNSEEIDKVQKKNLWALFFMSLIYGFASKPFFIVYQPFLLEITDSVFITGIFVTLGGILLFLPKPWVGRLSDRFNRKKVWLLELPFFYIGMTFLLFTENLIFLVPGIIFFHLSGAIGEIGYFMFISASSDKTKKGILFGLMFFGIFIGNICGEFFVMLDVVDDIRIYFILYIILDTFSYLILIFVISDPRSIRAKDFAITTGITNKKQTMWKDIFKSPKKRAVLIFFVLDTFIYSISLSILGAGLRAQYGLTYEEMAFIAIWLSISTMIFQIPGGHLADKIGKKRSLIVSELFGLSVFFIFILTFILWSLGFQIFLIPLLSVANILWGLNKATFIPSAQIILTDLDETRKAESYGISSFLLGIGLMPTGIIGGFLTEKVSYITPFILSFIGIIFLIWFLSKNFHD
ncbi:MAG: MFS transporter [Candidatus Lokiarchaeota archaeon]|nr:MFS transporter [Candidatus Lokiarchaeota archaeon]